MAIKKELTILKQRVYTPCGLRYMYGLKRGNELIGEYYDEESLHKQLLKEAILDGRLFT